MMITGLNTEDPRRRATQLPNQHKKIMCSQGVPTCPSHFQCESKKVSMTTNTLYHTKKLNLEQKYLLLNKKNLFQSFQCFIRGQRSCGHGVSNLEMILLKQVISIQKQELLHQEVTFTENRLQYTGKEEQIAMAIVYSS